MARPSGPSPAAASSHVLPIGDEQMADARPTRRAMLLGGTAAAAALAGPTAWAQPAMARPLLTRAIPSSGERLPVVGLGSWITFNVGNDATLRDECAAVVAAFVDAGGRMIDSSPMYGSAQATIGYALRKLGHPPRVFATDKVWISNAARGREQLEQSRALWGVRRFDLMQVHNLLTWEKHLDTLIAMKASGQIRYVGITTSEGRRHRELVKIMATRPLDFVQVTYNVLDRQVEERILPLARERGIAVIVNRPYRQKDLIRQVERYPLPKWLPETGAKSWAQFLLKFIISHPDVTCAIPATTRADHVRENLDAARGLMPDAALRKRMADYVRQL